MRDRPARRVRGQVYAVRAFAVFAALMTWGASLGAVLDADALRHGSTAPAIVVDANPGAADGQAVEIRFTTATGRTVDTTADWKQDPRPRTGDTGTVLYDPAHPTDNVIDARLGPPRYGGATTALVALVITAAAVFTFTARGRTLLQRWVSRRRGWGPWRRPADHGTA